MNTEGKEEGKEEVMDVQPEAAPNVENVEEDIAAEAEAPESAELANPTPSRYSAPTEPLTPADERTWAMLAHLSVLLNLVTGFLGIAGALVIYLVYKDRSRYVAYQSMQAFLFQLIFWAGSGLLIGAIWAVTGALSAILIGILLIPFAVILTVILIMFPVIALVYGVVGGIQCSEGQDFRYLLVGDWALNLI
ncbi:MAG: DUF4870 domain-containing protein [Anaerolineales bacterium]